MTQTVLLGTQSREPSALPLQRILYVMIALMTLPPLFYFCGDGGSSTPPIIDPPKEEEPLTGKRRVYFVSPADDAEVNSPVHVILGSELFTIEPAQNTDALDRGHFHVMVDADCLTPGEKMIPDAQHLDLANGEKEVTLQLTPGTHHLCLQAASGDHVALEQTAHIHFDVVE